MTGLTFTHKARKTKELHSTQWALVITVGILAAFLNPVAGVFAGVGVWAAYKYS